MTRHARPGPRHSSTRRERGFTLLEAIVTLLIFSLIIALLMQSLRQALQVRERAFHHRSVAAGQQLQMRWFTESIAAALISVPGEGMGFEGSASSMSLVTQAPLEDALLVRARWTIDPVPGGAELRFHSAAWPGGATVLRGPLLGARFSYLGRDGNWRSTWNPPDDEKERLPRAVKFQANATSGALMWIATPVVSVQPEPAVIPEGY